MSLKAYHSFIHAETYTIEIIYGSTLKKIMQNVLVKESSILSVDTMVHSYASGATSDRNT